jgi:membrane-bound lytic murein transglycosylase D
MSTRLKSILIFFSGAIAATLLISQLSFRENNRSNTDNHKDTTSSQQSFYLPVVPEQMTFAGEQVPLERWEIHEAFDRELIYNYYTPGHISYIIKLSKRYFPIIEERLKANGIPDDFKYLCVAESNLQNIISRVGATGFWQFMKDTSPGFGLTVNDQVDERYDVLKSTDAACKYLKMAYAKFGNWTAAAASYNCGMGGYNNQATFQKTYNYYDLNLPEETNHYIFRILAFKHLMSNAREIGYTVDDTNGYPPFNTKDVTVTATIPNLAEWAISNGTTYKMIRILNPWLRSRSLTVTGGRTYIIRLPE